MDKIIPLPGSLNDENHHSSNRHEEPSSFTVAVAAHSPTPSSIELTEIRLSTTIPEESQTRARAQQDNISAPLATFLEHMNLSLDAFEPSERAMLEIILAPKSWKKKLPDYLRLPLASELMAKVLFYMMVQNKDLTSTQEIISLSKQEINKGFRLHGNAIPLYDKQAIIRAYQITGFSNTVSWVGGVWLLLYLSLQINAVVLSIQNGQTDYKFSDIFLEPYNLYQLFSNTGQSTKASLANSLSSYAVWPFLIVIPLLGGAFSSWRYGKMAQQKNQAIDQADLTILETYTSNLGLDYLRWYIPNHPISGPLNRLRMNLLFNANESAQYRSQAFDVLGRLLGKAKGHTQLRSREVMAALAFSISPADLIKAKKISHDADYTPVIKTIAQAYFNLNGAAFSLKPQNNENRLDALLRAGKTRKLAHNQQLGHAGNLLLLFILYDLYISYGDASLSLIVLKGIIKAFQNLNDMVQCKQEDKVWGWRKESKNYECSVCGDEDQIAYRDIWTQESCMTAFLSRTQPADKIVNFLSSHRLQDLSVINFSAQLNAGWAAYHTTQELDAIFTAMNEHLPNLYNFTFKGNLNSIYLDPYPDSSYAGAALGQFLTKAKNLKVADFSYLFLQANGTADLVANLSSSTLTYLNLNYNNAGDQGILALVNVLPQTQLISLDVNNCESTDLAIPPFVKACFATPNLINIAYGASYTSDASAEELSKLLLQPNLNSLAVYSYLYTDVAIMAYASRVAQAKNLTKFAIEYFSMVNARTIRTLSDGIAQTPNQELVIQGYSGDPTVPDLGYLFYKLKDMPTTLLQISGTACVDEASAEAFSEYFPQSKVRIFQVAYCANPPLSSNATEQFARGLYQSNINSLTVDQMDLSNGLAGNFQRIILTPHLEFLILARTEFEENLSLAVIEMLPKSQLRTLLFGMNSITDAVVNRTAEILSQTHLKVINFGGNQITRFSIERLFDQVILPGSHIESFQIFESQLGDEGASYIAYRLPGTSLNDLKLQSSGIGDKGISKIAQALIQSVQYNLLWSDLILQADPVRIEPATQLTSMSFRGNDISPIGAHALIENLPYTNLPFSNIDFTANVNLTNTQLADMSMTSSATRQANIPWPIQLTYALLFTLPKQILASFSEQGLTRLSSTTKMKETSDEDKYSGMDAVTALIIMLLVYRFVLTPIKDQFKQSKKFGFFDTTNRTCTSVNERLIAAQQETELTISHNL
ncbi:MAG: hypothetical protein PSV35_10170 [bacterium]|nr:hypothetical protein [bacterium]